MNHREILLKEFTKNRNKYIKPEREYDDFVTPIPVEVALEAMQQARINAFRDVKEVFDTYSFDECTHPNELLEESIPDFKEATI